MRRHQVQTNTRAHKHRSSCTPALHITCAYSKDHNDCRRRDPQDRGRAPLRRKPLLVKRYARIAQRGVSLVPRKGGGRPPKTDQTTHKLLKGDLQERPTATVSERHRYLKHATSKSLTDSTVKRLLKRLGFSRKNGPSGRWSETNG